MTFADQIHELKRALRPLASLADRVGWGDLDPPAGGVFVRAKSGRGLVTMEDAARAAELLKAVGDRT